MHTIVQSKLVSGFMFIKNMNTSSYFFIMGVPSVYISMMVLFELIGNNADLGLILCVISMGIVYIGVMFDWFEDKKRQNKF